MFWNGDDRRVRNFLGKSAPLTLEESYASFKLYFALSNGNSNAEQVTNLLTDNIYNLSLRKGETGTGSVAFLHETSSNAPLQFVGFGSSLSFDIN